MLILFFSRGFAFALALTAGAFVASSGFAGGYDPYGSDTSSEEDEMAFNKRLSRDKSRSELKGEIARMELDRFKNNDVWGTPHLDHKASTWKLVQAPRDKADMEIRAQGLLDEFKTDMKITAQGVLDKFKADMEADTQALINEFRANTQAFIDLISQANTPILLDETGRIAEPI